MRSCSVVLLLLCIVATMSACRDHDDLFAYGPENIAQKKLPGTWRIEEYDLWVIDDVQTNSALATYQFKNVGEITFKEDETMDWVYEGGELDAEYLTLVSSLDVPWSYTGGRLIELGPAVTAYVQYMSNKEMVIMAPYTLNGYLTSRIRPLMAVEFRMKLRKE